jgi:chromate reductase
MKLLGISGSLRRASYNTALLHAAAELLPAGVELAIHDLHGLPLFDQDVEEQGDPAEVVALKDAVADADALLLASPEYNGGITGVLKNAIDWASRKGTARQVAPLTGKRVCIIGASPGITGTVRGQDALRLVLRRAGAIVEPQGEVLVFQAHTKFADGRLADERTREMLARHLQNFIAPLERIS